MTAAYPVIFALTMGGCAHPPPMALRPTETIDAGGMQESALAAFRARIQPELYSSALPRTPSPPFPRRSVSSRRSLLPPHFPAQSTDRWFADDKVRHFLMTFAVTQFGYGVARALGADGDAGLAAGFGGATIASIGKEVYDHRRGWGFSGRDLVWDAFGMAAAAALLRSVR